MRRSRLILTAAAVAVVLTSAPPAWAPRVGHVPRAFPKDAQNEPALAVDAHDPTIVALGLDDSRDMPSCRGDLVCSFDYRIGISGIRFSTNGGADFVQPRYRGNVPPAHGLTG